jgi:hypothetical protein
MQHHAVPPFMAAKMIHTLVSLYDHRVDVNTTTASTSISSQAPWITN